MRGVDNIVLKDGVIFAFFFSFLNLVSSFALWRATEFLMKIVDMWVALSYKLSWN